MNGCEWGVVIGVSLVAAVIDIRQGLIPNALTSLYTTMLVCWGGSRGGSLIKTAGESESENRRERIVMPYGIAVFIGVGIAAIGVWRRP